MNMNWISTISWVLLPQIGGIIGAIVSAKEIKTWYEVSWLNTVE
jgi:hypothetical protein